MTQCERCGNSDLRVLVKHHVLPRFMGGDDDISNLQVLCQNCHKIVHDDLRYGNTGAEVVQESQYFLKKIHGNFVCFVCGRIAKHLKPATVGEYKDRFLCEECYDENEVKFYYPFEMELEKKVMGGSWNAKGTSP